MWRTLIGIVLLVSICAITKADIYKWTDAKGVVHYEETPPKQGANTIEPSPLSVIEGYGDITPVPVSGETHTMSTSSSSSAAPPPPAPQATRKSSY